MKLNKIEKINFGSFKNFKIKSEVKDFCLINIILGWNGSGKSTLSKLVRSIETGDLLDGSKFSFNIDDVVYTENDNLKSIQNKIKVFNEDYVNNVISENKIFPQIFYVGEDSVDYSKEEDQLKNKKSELAEKKCINFHDKIAQETAQSISRVTGINSFKKEFTQGYYSRYDKTDFENRIKELEEEFGKNPDLNLSFFIQDNIQDIQHQLLDESNIKNVIESINNNIEWLTENLEDINSCLEKTPQQEVSDRIQNLSDKEKDWIKQGIWIHFSSNSNKENCIFCNSKVNNKDELLQHFSEAVVHLANKIDNYIEKLFENKNELNKHKDKGGSKHKIKIEKIINLIEVLISYLNEKKKKITENHVVLDANNVTDLEKEDSDINSSEIAYKIEKHYIAEKYNDYKKFKEEYNICVKQKEKLELEIADLQELIKTLKSKAQNTHQASSELNKIFKVAFPYRKIEIADNDDQTGYELRRDGNPCPFRSLSEGERNLIALSYFIKSLNDKDEKFDDEGVVIIDDPVSSLDKNSIFQIFSIITKEIENHNKRQYIILTHNLDFFGHIKENYQNKIKDDKCNLYHLNLLESGSEINNIHKLLEKHRSDYYYVFSVLNQYKEHCEMEDAYLMVNLLRRWIETFLEFKFPTTSDLREKIKNAYKKTKEINENFNYNSDELYRFITYGSHGFSDTEGIDESILNNTSERIRETFEMVKILDPMHFDKLSDCIKEKNTQTNQS